ncbi:MAG: error-prone DNA polymerase, partial [Planctomycetaceae bacterium]|nr:error-prone DNA polymerase [Planctomycetaceae bacterium]
MDPVAIPSVAKVAAAGRTTEKPQAFRPARPRRWGELVVVSNHTFLGGASHPEELVREAAALGHAGIALTDIETFGGSVRAHVAAREVTAAGATPSPGDPGMPGVSRAGAPFRLAHGTRVWLDIGDDGCGAAGVGASSSSGARHRATRFVRDGLAAHEALEIVLYASDRASWGLLCQLLTKARGHSAAEALAGGASPLGIMDPVRPARATGWQRRMPLRIHDLVESLASHPGGASLLAVIVPPALPNQRFLEAAEGLTRLMRDRMAVLLVRDETPGCVVRAERACALSDALGVPVAAASDVCMHAAARRPLLDTLACIREGVVIDRAGASIAWNAERRLRPVSDIERRFADRPDALDTAWRFIERASCFALDELRYEYPDEVVPKGTSPMQHLRELVWRGARERYPRGVPVKVARQFEHEFAIIDDLRYAPYFLTVHDIVAFARGRGILCQGRGAAANSAVCFALGVTAVDPDRVDVLFERFVSRERNEPPDIDIDFEHERREEVIQHIYRKYGRHRAALVCEVISYRGRSAVRDVGKALGFTPETLDRLAGSIDRWSGGGLGTRDDPCGAARDASLRAAGLDPSAPRVRQLVALVGEILGFPRHRSQHVGGFIISRGPLGEMVPIEHAAMEDRSIIEWDKDDVEALGMLKIDILSLGMLTAIRKTIDLVNGDRAALAEGADASHPADAPVPRRDFVASGVVGERAVMGKQATAPADAAEPLRFHAIPPEDPHTYDMICIADTIGVFQIESRAQMSMLPRLRPRVFYDLVVEVAIVRPGPIQGDMVHPYLRRRSGEEPIRYPDEAIRRVLGKTLGVPLFQEQAMALAVVAAGFTPGQADELRRAIAAWKRSGNQIARFGAALEEGMVARGYSRTFAQQVFEQIKGFSGYGFPESHAASFALLVYASAWLKRHHPAAFATALLNSQPMGFYAPAQIVRDAKEHGVAVRGVDIHCSRWDSTLERGPDVAPRLAEEARRTACGAQQTFAWATSEVDAVPTAWGAMRSTGHAAPASTVRIDAGLGAALFLAQHRRADCDEGSVAPPVSDAGLEGTIGSGTDSGMHLLERFRWISASGDGRAAPSGVRIQRWESMHGHEIPSVARSEAAFARLHGRGRSVASVEIADGTLVVRAAEPLAPPSPVSSRPVSDSRPDPPHIPQTDGDHDVPTEEVHAESTSPESTSPESTSP